MNEHTLPHSSQWWTREPLVARLTRPVRVYLMSPGVPSSPTLAMEEVEAATSMEGVDE